MDKVKILHTADVHIGAKEAHLEVQAQSRRFETVFTFENMIKAAVESGVQLFLIAGDLFDSNKVEELFVTRVIEAIEKAQSVHFILCSGNHDPLSADSPFLHCEIPHNLYILKCEDDVVEIPKLGTRVYGSSFDSVYKKGSARFSLTPPDDSMINIMCIHGELKSDLNSDYNSITADFIKNSGMDYIALGHIHRKTPVEKLAKTYVAYCGCPEPHGFDETGKKGFYMGDVSKQGCLLEFIPCAKREYVVLEVDITDKTDIFATVIEKIKDTCGENYRENLYKIVLSGALPEDAQINTDELCSRISNEVYFAKIKNETTFKIDFEQLSKEQSLKGIFVKKCLERIAVSDDEKQRTLLENALKIGVKSFSGEVKCDEN